MARARHYRFVVGSSSGVRPYAERVYCNSQLTPCSRHVQAGWTGRIDERVEEECEPNARSVFGN